MKPVGACSTLAGIVLTILATTTQTLDITGIDRSVAPGDNFFEYANGAWVNATPIPADRSSYGVASIVQDRTRERLVALIQDSGRSATNPEARKVGAFYDSFMDEATIEAKGLAPLKPALAAIARIDNKKALAVALGQTLRADVDPLNATDFYTDRFLGVFVAQSLDDPTRHSPYLLQGGLGMPDRDYYVSDSPRMTAIRAAYQQHIAAMLTLAGEHDADAREQASRIYDLERRMARAHATRVESQDVKAVQSWARTELAMRAPGLDWERFVTAAGLQEASRFYIWHPEAIADLASLVASEPLTVWKEWLRFHTIERAALYLPNAFDAERFAFNGTVLTGAPQEPERWKRGIDATNAALGWAVGRLYVERHFPPAAKAKAQAMSGEITKALGQRIDALDWMSTATKAQARAKLATIRVGVGYPDTWPDYSALQIVSGDALGNAERAALFDYRRALAKLGKTPDPAEWWITPQTVNALNLPLQNALNFPAARLQPPYFDPDGDTAANYGGVGAVIGHEVTHSFDDVGSQFDAQGRLRNWWLAEDLNHFQTAAERLVAQYDTYKPLPDLSVNGRQTLSENIADLAGLATPVDAYRNSVEPAAPVIDGFTGEQRLFISYAQARREKRREASLRNQLLTDGHAPSEHRANVVRNIDAWYESFQVKPGHKLYLTPDTRVRIW